MLGRKSDRTIERAKPGQHKNTNDEPTFAVGTLHSARARWMEIFGGFVPRLPTRSPFSFPDAVHTSLNTADVQHAKAFMLRKSWVSPSVSSELGGDERGLFMRNASRTH